MIPGLLQDLKYSARMLRKNPGFTFVAIAPFASVVPALLAVTLTAALIPARRASRIDPLIALGQE